MIDLYFWPTPNGYKAAIMLEETGFDYTVKPIDITAGDQFARAFLAISPNNKVPAIVDFSGPDGKSISVFESGAILIYLAEKCGKLIPEDPRQRIEVFEWLMFQMGGFGPMRIPGFADSHSNGTRTVIPGCADKVRAGC